MAPSRHEVSAAAHQDVPHANPLAADQMEDLVDWATRWEPTTALDIGCGPGSFSVGLASRAPVSVLAIDLNRTFLDRGRSAARNTVLVGNVEFVERPLQSVEGDQFDVVVCIGSSGAIGNPREALHRCKTLMGPNGVLVFAELVWKGEPDDDFLSFLGIDRRFLWPASEGIDVLEQVGLSVKYQTAASEFSWETYERAVLNGRLSLAADLPPEDGESVRRSARTWYANFEKHGRHCFGFNAYVARHAEA
ncbi:class I SAM-dependent methyltransferase [Rubrivivax albus]|uniref:Methyltransferase domain-containing protein n=1 Tax=Rubrivivax albus TaxID=2499835 RepID=A0A437JL52_9BURK|nr:methyltransferase domain-containing protein [Rubrivivax albus]